MLALSSMPLRLPAVFAAALWVGAGAPAFAESEPAHPMIDFRRLAPLESLQELELDELKARRAAYAAQLDAAVAPTAELEGQLLTALLAYDDERVRIVELIPQLIVLYELDAEFAEDLMNFRDTMSRIVAELKPNVTTLQSYKPYDFRMGVSFVALMTIMQEQQAVRERMLRDQEDPETLLGRYYQQLRSHYQAVEEARGQLEQGYRVEDVKDRVERIDAELKRRQPS